MAWRPDEFLIEGELFNTEPRKVTGWMQFQGMDDRVSLSLEGDFHRDIRGAGIQFYNDIYPAFLSRDARVYMKHFSASQTGVVGDITAGLPPCDYVSYPYIEWYSEENGRVVLELKCEQIALIGTPIPACESDPISRKDQQRNMVAHMDRMARDLRSQSESNQDQPEPPSGQSEEESPRG